ncbi:Crp/Fnr family transcriptional regulator [Listeria rustica]|uniref:Crp/Fnr family transcriptional regulator n=1 Tax=Listeria rustica TaxID=2713503 RepID=A0A7W1T5G6_9LIST|nr:Crp/Fnr family transcriptional regulator [Listeria rustica]MBA3925701.1 Crp/Fnr family transcriptional regulator [Listeria rustica]
MSYMALFDKDVMNQQFGSTQLLKVLSDTSSYPINKEEKIFYKKEKILSENLIHDYIYFIQSGVCVAWRNEHATYFVGEHDIVGMNDILGNEKSATSVIALTDVTTWRFSKKEVMSKLMYSQEGAFYLFQYMKETNKKLLQAQMWQMKDTKDRLISTLTHLGKLYGEEDDEHIIIPKFFTKSIVSNYLGMSRQHMTTLYRNLVNEGIFTTDPHQYILNKKEIAYA